jgi:chemotaxis protein CheD
VSDDPRMVGIGEYAIAGGSEKMVIYGLGSCAALILFDPGSRKAGLAHVLLPGSAPEGPRAADLPAKYAEDAMNLLTEGLGGAGGLVAAIVGGAHLFMAEGPAEKRVGNRNVESLKEGLVRRRIPLAWEDTGGDTGRTVSVELPACRVSVRTLREGWRTSFTLG